ncbi:MULTISPECIES: hypothetical protein [Rhodonellum]|nr:MULTISPECIES: hypothetical protein [Rhodonellum]
MKKLLILAFAMLPLLTFGQETGIGLRLGEPLSITYKTFIDDVFSIEAMVGSAGANSAQYYQRAFDNNLPAPNAFYSGHSTSNSFSFNLRGAYHEDFTSDLNIESGYLLGYAGAGVQLRSVRVDYAYTNPVSSGAPILRDRRTNIDFGPEIFGGAEYYFDDLPINVFAEIGLFMEVLNRFGHVRLQGAIGARYLF